MRREGGRRKVVLIRDRQTDTPEYKGWKVFIDPRKKENELRVGFGGKEGKSENSNFFFVETRKRGGNYCSQRDENACSVKRRRKKKSKSTQAKVFVEIRTHTRATTTRIQYLLTLADVEALQQHNGTKTTTTTETTSTKLVSLIHYEKNERRTKRKESRVFVSLAKKCAFSSCSLFSETEELIDSGFEVSKEQKNYWGGGKGEITKNVRLMKKTFVRSLFFFKVAWNSFIFFVLLSEKGKNGFLILCVAIFFLSECVLWIELNERSKKGVVRSGERREDLTVSGRRSAKFRSRLGKKEEDEKRKKEKIEWKKKERRNKRKKKKEKRFVCSQILQSSSRMTDRRLFITTIIQIWVCPSILCVCFQDLLRKVVRKSKEGKKKKKLLHKFIVETIRPSFFPTVPIPKVLLLLDKWIRIRGRKRRRGKKRRRRRCKKGLQVWTIEFKYFYPKFCESWNGK